MRMTGTFAGSGEDGSAAEGEKTGENIVPEV